MRVESARRGLPPLARLYFKLRRRSTLEHFDVLMEHERCTREELQAISDARLRHIVQYAYRNVPHYTALFDRLGLSPDRIATSADLQLIPPLTKELVREHFDALRARAPVEGVRQAATSGSTGEPLKFLIMPDVKAWHNAAKLRFWRYAGLELGMRHALVWGSTFDVQRLQRLSARLERWIGRQLLLNAFTLDPATLESHAARLARFKPQVIHGYAQAMHAIAVHMLARGTTVPSVRAVITTAETLHPHHRAAIERAFQCRVFNRYASRETALEVHECEQHQGLHISSDTAIVEVVDENGRWVGEGESGHLLVTDFNNLAMPFIRYRINDIGTATYLPCACGRPFPLLKSVEGRVNDRIVLRDGRVVHPCFMLYLMYRAPAQGWNEDIEEPVEGVRQFEIVQRAHDRFDVNLVLEPGYDERRLDYVVSNFKQHLGPEIDVRLAFVSSIPAGRSGKRRCVRSELGTHAEAAVPSASPG
ncbi:MAG TPA: hypothetical protein VFW66_05870 [Gemmatimonadales bacterium]|nr:hypothetical protein [Gemmatimonadales bacterium]